MVSLSILKNRRQVVVTTAITILCLVGITVLQLTQFNKLQENAKDKTIEEISRELEAERARLEVLQNLPAFGFRNILADWTFLNFIQYFGDKEIRGRTDYSLSPEFFKTIIKNDPRFVRAYIFLFTSTSIYAAFPEVTNTLMEQGTAEILASGGPRESYYIWRYKALNELLYLGDNQAAQQSHTIAARWANQYSDRESQNIAEISSNTAAFLANNPDTTIAQINAWISVFNSAVEDDVRQVAVRRMRDLGARVTVNDEGQLEVRLPEKYRERWGAVKQSE